MEKHINDLHKTLKHGNLYKSKHSSKKKRVGWDLNIGKASLIEMINYKLRHVSLQC